MDPDLKQCDQPATCVVYEEYGNEEYGYDTSVMYLCDEHFRIQNEREPGPFDRFPAWRGPKRCDAVL
jgi:hypothetical protein